MIHPLTCRCGLPVGIVRLNGRVLSLGHKRVPGSKHVIRLARPGADSLPGENQRRTREPANARLRGRREEAARRDAPGTLPANPATPSQASLQPSEGASIAASRVPLARDDSARSPLSAGTGAHAAGAARGPR